MSSPPPATGLLGGFRRIGLGNSDIAFGSGPYREVDQWGRGLWEGFASFDVVLTGIDAGTIDKAYLVDATGAQYELSKTRTHFDRLPVPLRLLASTDLVKESFAQLTSVRFEVTRTNTIPTLSGKYDGTNPILVRMVGADLRGVTMKMSAQARFYDNFTNGAACSRVVFTDSLGQMVTLQPSSTSQELTLTAPVEVRVQPICVSSRRASQENSDADFDLAISTIGFDPTHTPPPVIIHGGSDSQCSDYSAVASVEPLTDCASLSDSNFATSVQVDGRCIFIRDYTTIRQACIDYHP